MPGRQERVRRQDQREREEAIDQLDRPNIAPRPVLDPCPAALGRDHDYSMSGRCWYCAKPKPEKA